MNPVAVYINKQKEPYQSIMLYVRSVLLKSHQDINERISYGIPFFYYKKRPLCYLNILKGRTYVDLVFMHGVLLEKEFPELRDDNQRKKVRSLQLPNIGSLNEKRCQEMIFKSISMMK